MARVPFYAKSENGKLVFSNHREIQEYLHSVNGKQLKVLIERATGRRSDDQNSALHLWFEMLANTLNEAGFSVQQVLAKKMDMDWSAVSVKEFLWRPAQKKLIQKESTTELAKIEEIDLVFDHLNRHLAEKFEIEVPSFPFDPSKRR